MNTTNSTHQRRLLFGAAAATCIANISWWMQPQIVNDVLTGYRVSESMAGFVVTAEFAVMALASFVLARLARHASYFAIGIVGTLVALGGAALTLVAHHYSLLIVARAITGAGEGAALMVSTAAVAHLTNPDRAYCQLNIVNICLGAAMSLALPKLVTMFGADALAFRLLFVVMLVLAVLVLPTPRDERYDPPVEAGAPAGIPGRVIALATAVFLVAVMSSAMWSFYVVLGLRTGLGAEQVDQAIAVSVLSALPAGLLATFIGTRFGRFTTMVTALVIITIAIVVLTHSTSTLVFYVGTCVNVAGIYFLLPYFFGLAAAEDPSGRAAAITGGAFLLTGAAGPYLGGSLMEYAGVASIAWFILGSNTVSAAVLFWLERGRTRMVGQLVAAR